MKEIRDSFDRFPDQYIDAIEENQDNNYFLPVIAEILTKIPEPTSVCDVGCGNGVFSISIKDKIDCTLFGVDGSIYAVTEARKIGFDEVHQINDFCNDHLPFPSGSMDLVICKDVLEHLLDPQFLVSELARITKPNGFCVIHVPNHFPIIGRLRLLFSNNIDTFNYFPESNRWDFPHIRFFDKSSITNLALRSGLFLELDLSWHFFRPARLAKYIPWIARKIGNKYSDATSEGITILFKKK